MPIISSFFGIYVCMYFAELGVCPGTAIPEPHTGSRQ